MALQPVRVPQLQQSIPVVDDKGRMTNEFARRLNEILGNLGYAINQVLTLPEIQAALEQLDAATQAAQDAADSANASVKANKREAALQGSYIEPSSVLSATPTTITIAAHVRHYTDGTTANVSAGTVPATVAGDTDYVSYSDPARAGGAVTFQASTTAPVQTGDVHVVGAVMIPATGTANGGDGPRPPGYVQAKVAEQ